MQPATKTTIGVIIFVTCAAVFHIPYLPELNNNTKFFTSSAVWKNAFGNTQKGLEALLSKINEQLKQKNALKTPSDVFTEPSNLEVQNNTRSFILAIQPQGRLGNQMFLYASILGIASKNNRTPILLPTGDEYNSRLWQVCQLSHWKYQYEFTMVKSFNRSNKTWEKSYAKYDSKFETLPEKHLYLPSAGLQSWKYFKDIELEVKKELRFKPNIDKQANDMFLSVVPSGLEVVTVGIHVRRGDYLHPRNINRYLPSKTYYDKAMKYFRDKYDKVKFLVATNGPEWIKENVVGDDVILLEDAIGEVHMATLAKCNHVIMSVGTFGWWAGYLAGGDVIYFTPPFRNGSALDKHYSEEDFFPPKWIRMTD